MGRHVAACRRCVAACRHPLDSGERCGMVANLAISQGRNENTIYNFESELVTRLFILNSIKDMRLLERCAEQPSIIR
jgi:hypothetical protein